jgi:hypothetical protein
VRALREEEHSADGPSEKDKKIMPSLNRYHYTFKKICSDQAASGHLACMIVDFAAEQVLLDSGFCLKGGRSRSAEIIPLPSAIGYTICVLQ